MKKKTLKEVLDQYGWAIKIGVYVLWAIGLTVSLSGEGSSGFVVLWVLLWVGGNVIGGINYYTSEGVARNVTIFFWVGFNVVMVGHTINYIFGVGGMFNHLLNRGH